MLPAPPSELPLVPASWYSNDIWLLRDDNDLVEPISFYNEHWEKTPLIQKQQAQHRGATPTEEVNEDTAHHPAIMGDMKEKYDQRMTLVAAPAGSQVPMNQWPNLPAASCEGVDAIFGSHYSNHPPNVEAIRAHHQVKMEGASSPLGEASMSSDSRDGSPRELQGYKHQNLLNQRHHQAQTVENTSIQVQPKCAPPQKKKRSLPGTPDPDAEVIALSPRTLMATNRFMCEICNKGFQRDQNLQLHRRGHNLPWKLRQRSSQEIRKRVYICPEPSCVYHDPARALGDLTGIKKHFCRKHGEKKWKCEKCSKRYAVQSDWKAHMKTCGTREYRCDCGTLFSRRDSFITHRAFCDALAEENRRDSSNHQQQFGAPGDDGRSLELVSSLDHHRQMVMADTVAAGISGAAGAEPLSVGFLKQQAAKTGVCDRISMSSRSWKPYQQRSSMGGAIKSGLSLWPLGNGTGQAGPGPPAILTHHHQLAGSSHHFASSGSSAGRAASFVLNSPPYGQEQQGHLAQMSATALLQKASLMGATMGNSSILCNSVSMAALGQCTDAAAVSLLRRPAAIQNKMEQIAGSGGRNMEELAGMRGFRGSNAGSCSLFEINSSADHTFPISMAIMRDFEGGTLNTASSVLTTAISMPQGLKATPSQYVGKTATSGKASFDDSPSYGESRPSNRPLSPCYGNMRSLREEHGDHQKPTLDFLGMVAGGQTCTTISGHVFSHFMYNNMGTGVDQFLESSDAKVNLVPAHTQKSGSESSVN